MAKKIKKTAKPVKAAAKAAPRTKKAVAKQKASLPVRRAPVTTIVARIDIGWGNRLYVRGSGAGLSWDVGIPMECSKDDEWYWKTAQAKETVVFKFLKNDERWSIGEDLTVEPGQTSTSTPQF